MFRRRLSVLFLPVFVSGCNTDAFATADGGTAEAGPEGSAADVTVETGMSDGGPVEGGPSDGARTHKLIWLTIPSVRGSFNSLAQADLLCSGNKPAGVVGAKALIAGGGRVACLTENCSNGASEHTDWPLLPVTDYRRSDGTLVGTTNTVAIFDALTNPVASGATAVWTGMKPNPSQTWTSWTTGDTCINWTDTITTVNKGFAGQLGISSPFGKFQDDCANNDAIYCVEL